MAAKPNKTPAKGRASAATRDARPAATGGETPLLAPPPLDLKIPAPPLGARARGTNARRGVVPTADEKAAIPGAMHDVAEYAEFDALFGHVKVGRAEVMKTFDVAYQWTLTRRQAAAFAAYATGQEAVAWTAVRALMKRMKPLLLAHAESDPSFAHVYPGLLALFSAKRGIAKKGVSTKRANLSAERAGEPQVHGVVGRRRQTAAGKALLQKDKASGRP